jgi:hypothetical protein
MATQKFINNFRTTIAATFGAGDTILQVADTTGLPVLSNGDFFLLTVFRQAGIQESGWEVVKVTGMVGNNLTVQRSAEGAGASQFLAGSIVAARLTAGSLEAKADKAALGTAAGKNVPAAGNAAATEVVLGNDARLSDARTPVTHTHPLSSLVRGTNAGGDVQQGNMLFIDNDTVYPGYLRDVIHTVINYSDSNGTVRPAFVSYTAYSGQAIIDFIITPSGAGAFACNVPDATATGGNKRGQYANDFQRSRSTAAMVASGDYSTLLGGRQNTVSANYSTIAGGWSNSATGLYSAVSGGWSNKASGVNSNVAGGNANTASGEATAVGGGTNNSMWAKYSCCPGGGGADDFGIIGSHVWGGAASSASTFHSQVMGVLLVGLTTGTTPVVLTTNGAPYNDAGTINFPVMPDNCTFAVEFTIMARNVLAGTLAVGVSSMRSGIALFTRQVGESTITKVSEVNISSSNTGVLNPTSPFTVDTVTGGIKITVTGPSGTSVQWLANLKISMVRSVG